MGHRPYGGDFIAAIDPNIITALISILVLMAGGGTVGVTWRARRNARNGSGETNGDGLPTTLHGKLDHLIRKQDEQGGVIRGIPRLEYEVHPKEAKLIWGPDPPSET